MKNIVLKYALSLSALLIVVTCFHFGAIAPLIETLCIDDLCVSMIQGFSLFIAEPVFCIMIAVYFINKLEKQYYDSLL